MCWADRLVLAVLAVWLLALFGLGYSQSYSYSPNNDPLNALEFTAFIFIPAWVALRLIDFALGGPKRRAGRIRATWVR